MEQERELYKTEVEQLRGDLEVTRIESAKEGTKKSEKVCCCTNVHYLRHGLSAVIAPCRERH